MMPSLVSNATIFWTQWQFFSVMSITTFNTEFKPDYGYLQLLTDGEQEEESFQRKERWAGKTADTAIG